MHQSLTLIDPSPQNSKCLSPVTRLLKHLNMVHFKENQLTIISTGGGS